MKINDIVLESTDIKVLAETISQTEYFKTVMLPVLREYRKKTQADSSDIDVSLILSKIPFEK